LRPVAERAPRRTWLLDALALSRARLLGQFPATRTGAARSDAMRQGMLVTTDRAVHLHHMNVCICHLSETIGYCALAGKVRKR